MSEQEEPQNISRNLSSLAFDKEGCSEKGFGKKYHLLKPSEFQQVYRQKIWTGNREFAVNLCRNQLPHARLGLVVSKKVSKRAVDRNMIKRHVREWFRHNREALNGFDVIVTAKPTVLNKSAPQQRIALADLWKKAYKKSLSCPS